ncbi:MAG: sigma-70 family RNA polymerase sigma factor [Burkholderiales bacterium]
MKDLSNAHALKTHKRYLHSYAVHKVRDPDLADDLVQETFVAALSTKVPFEGRSTPRTWLVAILRRKIADAYRERARQPISLDALSGDAADAADWIGEPERDLETLIRSSGYAVELDPCTASERKRFWEHFERCLQQLPRRTAHAFVLSEILGHDAREVSELMGTTPTNVWCMLHRARACLRMTVDVSGHAELFVV